MQTKVIQVDERPPLLQSIPLSIQHLFAMFSASVLVPTLFHINPAVVLLMNGIGTLLFILITKGKAPAFLGSSFAFLAPVWVIIDKNGLDALAKTSGGPVPVDTALYAKALGGFVVAGAVCCLVALIVKWFGTKWIGVLMPPAAMGPIVALIGLELAGNAAESIVRAPVDPKNVAVFCITLAVAVFGSVLFRKFFAAIPILIAILVGYVAAMLFGIVNRDVIDSAQWFALPHFTTPIFSLDAIFMILPAALVVVNEHIGHQLVTGKVVGRDLIKDPGLHRSLFADGFSTMLSGFVGAVPTTTYGENIGVMAITKVYSVWVIAGAAVISIAIAFIGKISGAIQTIPAPVMGGISFLLYGMIASSGIRLMIESKIDYSRSRNLALTSVVFIVGLSGISINVNNYPMKGMTLAAIVGMALSLVFYVLDRFHLTNDSEAGESSEGQS